MSVNYKKLKSQLKPSVRNGKFGWYFSITGEQQENRSLFPVFIVGRSKRKALKYLEYWVHLDEDFFNEFGI